MNCTFVRLHHLRTQSLDVFPSKDHVRQKPLPREQSRHDFPLEQLLAKNFPRARFVCIPCVGECNTPHEAETSQQLAKARSCASRDLSLGGRHPCMMRSAWERVNSRTSAASASRTSLWLEGSGTAPTASRMDSTASPATKSVSMASLASQRLRWSPHRHSGARLLLPYHHLPTSHTLHRHMAPDYRIINRNLTGASSGATGPPRQGQRNTLRSFMSTACQIHVFGSLQTKPIPSVAKHLLITVGVHRQRALSNPGSSGSKTALLTLLQISTALSTATRTQVHISFGCEVTQLAIKPSGIRHVLWQAHTGHAYGNSTARAAHVCSHIPSICNDACTGHTSNTKIRRWRLQQHSQPVTQYVAHLRPR